MQILVPPEMRILVPPEEWIPVPLEKRIPVPLEQWIPVVAGGADPGCPRQPGSDLILVAGGHRDQPLRPVPGSTAPTVPGSTAPEVPGSTARALPGSTAFRDVRILGAHMGPWQLENVAEIAYQELNPSVQHWDHLILGAPGAQDQKGGGVQ